MTDQALTDRIASMLAKTEESGASEEEANNAMRLAMKMMDKYGVTMADLEARNTKAEEFTKKFIETGRKGLHEVDSLMLMAVGKYTDTKVWVQRSQSGIKIAIFGFDADVQLAEYMRDILQRSMESEWNSFFSTYRGNEHGRRVRKSFMMGMTNRLRERMEEMKSVQKAAQEKAEAERSGRQTGTSLVVMKAGLIQSELNKQGMRFRSTKGTGATTNSGYAAGQSAGNRVGFNAGVSKGATAGRMMLGR